MSEPDGARRFFPYEEPYDHQADAMERIREALVEERDVLFEGACGTGKTLASLVPQAPSKRTSRCSTKASRMRSIASAWWSYGSSYGKNRRVPSGSDTPGTPARSDKRLHLELSVRRPMGAGRNLHEKDTAVLLLTDSQ